MEESIKVFVTLFPTVGTCMAVLVAARWVHGFSRELLDRRRELEMAKLQLEILQLTNSGEQFQKQRDAIMTQLFLPPSAKAETPHRVASGAELRARGPSRFFGTTTRQEAGVWSLIGSQVGVILALSVLFLLEGPASAKDTAMIIFAWQVLALGAGAATGSLKHCRDHRALALLSGAVLPLVFIAVLVGSFHLLGTFLVKSG